MIPALTFATPHGDVTLAVEIATTPDAIARGLMYRTQLPWDQGMLFVMGGEGVWSFYMRNTFIPLDMIFIDRGFIIAGIVHSAEPCTETRRHINRPSSYVLEVNGGWSRAYQIVKGTRVIPGYCNTSRRIIATAP